MLEQDCFTIAAPFWIELEIKKSHFIGRAYPIKDEEEANRILALVKKEHYKANHVCWAWVLNTVPEKQKSSDDGEPSGTAGKPILEVINKKHLKNILVLVIRYFGGIKLGAGGLVRAYSGSAAEVLNQGTILKKQFSDILKIEIDYTSYGGLMSVLADAGYKPSSETFLEKVSLNFEIGTKKTSEFLALIRETTNNRFDSIILEKRFVDICVQDS